MGLYNLLIVDDERIIRDGIMSFNWEDLGFKAVIAAADGEEAIRILESDNRIDAVITDIKMPVIDGLGLSKYISNNFSECKVVILTGYKDFEYAKTAISAGVFDYLLKPVDMDEINRVFTSLKKELDNQRMISDINENSFTPAILSAIQYIEEKYSERLSLDSIADTVYLSPVYLSSIFAKETGKTITEYISEIRIKHSKVLLKKPGLKVYEIAEKVGYPNPKYFSDVFKKHTGLTPVQYRKQKPT